jgi:hypothetical protein
VIAADGEKDLIVLVADSNMRLAITELLQRHHSLEIRQISAEVREHIIRDPGVYREGHAFLQAQSRNFQYSIAICDREGCGGERSSREQLESTIERNLSAHWPDRSAAIIIDPELEAWVWTESQTLLRALDWQGDYSTLRDWLQKEGFSFNGPVKPARPKEALELVLRSNRLKRSGDLYKTLARAVTLTACTDPAFEKLRRTLQRWFPKTAPDYDR